MISPETNRPPPETTSPAVKSTTPVVIVAPGIRITSGAQTTNNVTRAQLQVPGQPVDDH